MKNEIVDILQSEYDVITDKITPTTGGWSALAYKVDSIQGQYFLKVYDKKRVIIKKLLENLDFSMSVSSWLEKNTSLQGRINAPILTKSDSIKSETQDYTYLLFQYIDGENVCTTPLTERQQKEIAEIVGTLHNCVEDMPFDFTNITEDFTIPCKELMKVPGVSSGDFCVYNERDMIMRAIEKAHTLADKVKSNDPYFALCHTDIHGWNLMQSDQLILIDWESIKFAPVEADLYTFWNDWYWGDSNWGSYWNTFLPIYSNICTDYVVNKENLLFYQMRRHIEDIEEFYKQYLYEEMTNETRREVISCLERECRFLSTLIH